LKVMPLAVNSACSERSISKRSARSLIAAASKFALTMSCRSAGRPVSARRLAMIQ
jgi:hypothetical protein